MAAPVPTTKGTIGLSTGGNCSPTLPAPGGGILANDIVFALFISHQPVSVGVINTLAGWTEVAQITYRNSSLVNQGRVGLFYRRMAGGESGTITFSRTGDTGSDTCFHGQTYLIRGCETTGDPYDAASIRNGDGATTVTWDAVTVSGGERTLLAFCAQADDTPLVATPSTYARTLTAEGTTSGTDAQFAMDDKQNVSTDGSVTAANGETIGWATIHVSAKPPAGGGGGTGTPLHFFRRRRAA